MRARITVAALAVVAGCAAFAVPACGGGGSKVTPAAASPTIAPTPTEELIVRQAAEDFFRRLGRRNESLIRDALGAQLSQQLAPQQLQRLLDCVPAGSTVQPEPYSTAVSGNRATVTVSAKLTRADGTTASGSRTWEFEKHSDGTWRLSAVPECPFS